MEALAELQQEGEECNLKVEVVEVEEEEVGLLRKQSTTRKYGVDEGGVSGNANSSRTSSRTSFNGTHAEEEPEAEREWVEEVNCAEYDVEEQGQETEAEQETGEEVTNAGTYGSSEEHRPQEELEDENVNDGQEQEAAPEPDEMDENENDGGENGKGDVVVLAPAAKVELHIGSGVKGEGSTGTNIVHFNDERGTESIQTIVKTEYSHIERVSYETETVHETSDVAAQRFSAFLSSQVDHQDRGSSGDERFLDLALLSPRKSSEEKNTYSKESKVVEEVDLIGELNPEETDFDVEKVLEKQNTHDLYCPNCHSCITRRVILRRKKRKVPNVRHRGKYDKVEKTAASVQHAQPVTVVEKDHNFDAIASIEEVPAPAVVDNISTPEVDGSHNDRERECFRCLSCFSIFIPTVDGFKLFWPFGERKEVKKVQDPSEVPVAESSTSAPRKGETVIQQGETLAASGQSLEYAYTKPETEKVIPPSAPIALVVGQTLTKIDQKSVEETAKELPDVSAPAITEVFLSPAQPSLAKSDKVEDSATKWQRVKNIQQAINFGKELRDAVKKTPEGDVIVVVDGGVEAAAAITSPTSDVAAQVEEPPQTGNLTLREEPPVVQVPQPRQPREWDILKSIVYGGLIESITSLGVVSSAAGAGAATLNTLGLGLANLFGGLLVIAHNLRELKNEQPSQGTEQGGRYEEVLGKRQRFPLHTIVAILSFIIFGCVAPITYAFSFRESDNRDYKLAAVAGASLFCIFLLAIGKAHVGKPPKTYFKTVLLYVVMGLMASGVSFLVGELIDELLTKLGWFDTTSSLSGTRPLETGSMQSGWASY
ncbi:hypothetical protein BT93_A1346 [Corymbia citriodora subsp. variegata]|nr:hypothetical protein BT93_A1346 [Corymbia citriodora subsp. variegata]